MIISPKLHIFIATCIGGYTFFNIVGLKGRSHKILDNEMGGHKNIAEVLLEIHDLPIPPKMVSP